MTLKEKIQVCRPAVKPHHIIGLLIYPLAYVTIVLYYISAPFWNSNDVLFNFFQDKQLVLYLYLGYFVYCGSVFLDHRLTLGRFGSVRYYFWFYLKKYTVKMIWYLLWVSLVNLVMYLILSHPIYMDGVQVYLINTVIIFMLFHLFQIAMDYRFEIKCYAFLCCSIVVACYFLVSGPINDSLSADNWFARLAFPFFNIYNQRMILDQQLQMEGKLVDHFVFGYGIFLVVILILILLPKREFVRDRKK